MLGLFRPRKLGKVFSYSNQFVETSFLFFLVPLKSYFIDFNSKTIIEIPLNRVSLRNYYASLILVTSGILFFVLMIRFGPHYSDTDKNAYLGYIPAIVSGTLILSGLICSFKIGKSDPLETKKRTIFQDVVGLNALPEWLSADTIRNTYEKYKKNLPTDWRNRILNEKFSTDDFFLYYTMLSYLNRISQTNENIELLNILNKRLVN